MKIKAISATWLSVFCFLLAVPTACKTGVPDIRIELPQASLSTVMLESGSIFMKIINTGKADDILVSAQAEIPDTVTELHDVQNGKMVKLERIDIPANSTVELKPSSHHIMVFKLPKNVKEGYEFKLKLIFKKSGEKNVSIKFTSYASSHSH